MRIFLNDPVILDHMRDVDSVEIMALDAGLKKVVKLEPSEISDDEEIISALHKEGYFTRISLKKALLVSKSEKYLEEAYEIDSLERTNAELDNTKKMGELLGYPECCTEFFFQNYSQNDYNP